MLFPNIPEKWKKAIPAFLTGGSWIALGLLWVFGAPVTVLGIVLTLVSNVVGLLLGINWTPIDVGQ